MHFKESSSCPSCSSCLLTGGGGRRDDGAPLRRVLTEEMSNEEVEPFPFAVLRERAAASGIVFGAGNHQEVEILVCFEQRADDLQRGRGIDVGVELANDQQNLPLQLVRMLDVRRSRILRSDR